MAKGKGKKKEGGAPIKANNTERNKRRTAATQANKMAKLARKKDRRNLKKIEEKNQ